jgi:thioredoxin-related protein
MKTIFTLPVALLIACASAHAASASGWTDDYAKAVEKAKAEKKNILLDFTGSDWCGFCIALDNEVFDTSKFKSWARQNAVLVKVDFPHGKKLSDKVKAQNAELKEKFMKSGGFPTVVIIDPDGKEIARKRGYRPGTGPAAYLKELAPAK